MVPMGGKMSIFITNIWYIICYEYRITDSSVLKAFFRS